MGRALSKRRGVRAGPVPFPDPNRGKAMFDGIVRASRGDSPLSSQASRALPSSSGHYAYSARSLQRCSLTFSGVRIEVPCCATAERKMEWLAFASSGNALCESVAVPDLMRRDIRNILAVRTVLVGLFCRVFGPAWRGLARCGRLYGQESSVQTPSWQFSVEARSGSG